MTIRNLGLEVELKHVDFQKGENKTEEFGKLSAMNQVPVLVDDDGFVLTESRAIASYLINSRCPEGSSLYPMDAMKRAIVDQRLFYDANVVFPAHIEILVKILTRVELTYFIYSFFIYSSTRWCLQAIP